MTQTYAISALLVFASLQSFAAQKLVCTVNGPHTFHKLTVTVDDSRVTAFQYQSMTRDPAAYTCDFSGARASSSSWVSTGSETLIAIEGPDGKRESSARVRMRNSGNSVRLQFLNADDFAVHNWQCGLNGYVAPAITLVKGSKICRLH